MEILVKSALDSVSTVKKHQKTFILQLFFALIVVQGKATFLNMSRYSSMSEKRFRRWYRRAFDFFTLNWLMLSGVLSNSTEKIADLDVLGKGAGHKTALRPKVKERLDEARQAFKAKL